MCGRLTPVKLVQELRHQRGGYHHLNLPLPCGRGGDESIDEGQAAKFRPQFAEHDRVTLYMVVRWSTSTLIQPAQNHPEVRVLPLQLQQFRVTAPQGKCRLLVLHRRNGAQALCSALRYCGGWDGGSLGQSISVFAVKGVQLQNPSALPSRGVIVNSYVSDAQERAMVCHDGKCP